MLVVAEKTGTFRVRMGIQVTGADTDLPEAPLNPSDAANTGTAYVSSAGRTYFNFEPTRGSNGNTNTKGYFRVGVLYSNTDGTTCRGDVILRCTYTAA